MNQAMIRPRPILPVPQIQIPKTPTTTVGEEKARNQVGAVVGETTNLTITITTVTGMDMAMAQVIKGQRVNEEGVGIRTAAQNGDQVPTPTNASPKLLSRKMTTRAGVRIRMRTQICEIMKRDEVWMYRYIYLYIYTHIVGVCGGC